jgi:heavy metal sensor kinase
MTFPWPAPTIRARLTGWYAVVLAAMMVVYSTVTYIAVRHEFLNQLDERLHEDFESAEDRLTRTADGRVTWTGAGHHDAQDDESRVYEVWSASGEQIHRSEERVREELSEVLAVLAFGLPLVVALAGIGGYALARRALAPIDHLASEAQRITADRLNERLTVPNQRDEIGRLTAVINETFARLECSFDQLRRFTADSSHELRTPLAVVRGIGEAAVAERRTPREYEEAIGSMLEEVDGMSNLVDTLLRLSHGDAGSIRLSRETLDLGELARDVTGSLGILAEERNQALALDLKTGVTVSVDRLVLREAIANVLDNAIKYSPKSSTIAVRVEPLGNQGLLAIADEGPGILPEHRERIFDRFFRVDEARSREHGGAGLGLAIAKWAVEIHGGQILVHERSGPGSEFRILLPLATR